jgi:hypothetical protein
MLSYHELYPLVKMNRVFIAFIGYNGGWSPYIIVNKLQWSSSTRSRCRKRELMVFCFPTVRTERLSRGSNINFLSVLTKPKNM